MAPRLGLSSSNLGLLLTSECSQKVKCLRPKVVWFPGSFPELIVNQYGHTFLQDTVHFFPLPLRVCVCVSAHVRDHASEERGSEGPPFA